MKNLIRNIALTATLLVTFSCKDEKGVQSVNTDQSSSTLSKTEFEVKVDEIESQLNMIESLAQSINEEKIFKTITNKTVDKLIDLYLQNKVTNGLSYVSARTGLDSFISDVKSLKKSRLATDDKTVKYEYNFYDLNNIKVNLSDVASFQAAFNSLYEYYFGERAVKGSTSQGLIDSIDSHTYNDYNYSLLYLIVRRETSGMDKFNQENHVLVYEDNQISVGNINKRGNTLSMRNLLEEKSTKSVALDKIKLGTRIISSNEYLSMFISPKVSKKDISKTILSTRELYNLNVDTHENFIKTRLKTSDKNQSVFFFTLITEAEAQARQKEIDDKLKKLEEMQKKKEVATKLAAEKLEKRKQEERIAKEKKALQLAKEEKDKAAAYILEEGRDISGIYKDANRSIHYIITKDNKFYVSYTNIKKSYFYFGDITYNHSFKSYEIDKSSSVGHAGEEFRLSVRNKKSPKTNELFYYEDHRSSDLTRTDMFRLVKKKDINKEITDSYIAR